MRSPHLLLPALVVVLAVPAGGSAQSIEKVAALPDGLVLIGAKTREAPESRSILVQSEGTLKPLFRRDGGSVSGGRLARDRSQLAFLQMSEDETWSIWVVDDAGNTRQVGEGFAGITAWSPDGTTIGLYRSGEDGDYESFELDVATRQTKRLELPPHYTLEDWHPRENTRTAMYFNPRNAIHRESKGDSYPTRQLDLVKGDAEPIPLTKGPCTDNIWSRYSADGEHIAHYQRRFVDGNPREYAMVCAADGSNPWQVFAFTDTGHTLGLPWFRPLGPPTWSPDGRRLAWLVTSNDESRDDTDDLELVLIPVDGGTPQRLSLTSLGFEWVQAIEWR